MHQAFITSSALADDDGNPHPFTTHFLHECRKRCIEVTIFGSDPCLPEAILRETGHSITRDEPEIRDALDRGSISLIDDRPERLSRLSCTCIGAFLFLDLKKPLAKDVNTAPVVLTVPAIASALGIPLLEYCRPSVFMAMPDNVILHLFENAVHPLSIYGGRTIFFDWRMLFPEILKRKIPSETVMCSVAHVRCKKCAEKAFKILSAENVIDNAHQELRNDQTLCPQLTAEDPAYFIDNLK